MEKVVVSIPSVATYAQCDYNTARAALKGLEKLKIVEQMEKRHPQTWWAAELVDLVYEA